ncbi:hypothetical protein ACFQ2M_35315 [Kitasatospora saccharophila]|uniref:hypothetical protein n=1 Tax=Kitasatospora saccharophila TaxID=407973 RepID=UPI003639FA62
MRRRLTGAAGQLTVTGSTVAKHIDDVLAELDLPDAEADHRRVPAVLRFLGIGA